MKRFILQNNDAKPEFVRLFRLSNMHASMLFFQYKITFITF